MTQPSGEVGFLHVPAWLIDVELGSFLVLVWVNCTEVVLTHDFGGNERMV